MKNTIRSWLNAASMGSMNSAGGVNSPGGVGSVNLPASSGRAVQALQAAVRMGGVEALLQTPLESIVGNDTTNLHLVRQAIELERRIVTARLAARGGGDAHQLPVVSYFTSINAGWEDSDFDSGAESEMDEGSDVTDLETDFD